ncbi:hypothetical protein TNCT_403031 [Trichonephila clavata]|uniref:Uncharacterized protein n=1 Tax=Trichonephila clavata TaxID=2740835 RepID=A0A8X6KHR1_TRICU|nr:hypothetical protein TNCT_403031 [Trichonephila clavata]
MEDSKRLENTARIFATKLVHCVMQKYIPNWIPEVAIEDEDDIFSDYVKSEINVICILNSLVVKWEIQENFVGKEETKMTFEKFCTRMSSIIQHEEENRERFLYYAAKLAKVAIYIYDNVVEAPDIAIGHITNVLVARYPSLVQKIPDE